MFNTNFLSFKNTNYIMPVRIKLSEAHSKKPITFTKVYLMSPKHDYESPTDAKGWATIRIKEDGYYNVLVRSPDHRPYTKHHELSMNSILEIDLERAYE